jgi:hypothetical protein
LLISFFSFLWLLWGGWVGGFEDGRLPMVAKRDNKRVMGLWFERQWGCGLLIA